MLTPAEIDEFQSALIDYLINQPTKYKNEKIPVFKALAPLIAVQKCQNSADGACSSGDNIAEKVYQGMTDAGLNPEEDVLYFNGGAYMEESTIIDLFNEMGGSYDPNADEQTPITVDGVTMNIGDDNSLSFGNGECAVKVQGINSAFINLVNSDKFALFGCPYSDWVSVASFKPSQSVLNRVSGLANVIFDYAAQSPQRVSSNVQFLEDAAGTSVNLDYFPVRVSQLPTGYTANSFLNYFRNNINSFIDTNLSEFLPHPSISGEISRWQNSPLGSIVYIAIPGDPGTVVCSDYNSDSWTFSTIFDAPRAKRHPVSGNRKFGYTQNVDGSYTFYTRGVDRLTSSFDQLFSTLSKVVYDDGIQFEKADELWRSMQKGIADFINGNGGNAEVKPPQTKRPDWEEVKDVLLNRDSQVDCN
jgi:hypothetical protein